MRHPALGETSGIPDPLRHRDGYRPAWSRGSAPDLGDPEETTSFALAPGHWGAAYIFGQDGTPFVFSADLGPDATEADADEVNSIVQSSQLSSR